MAGISDEKLEELRERVDVATVVGRRVQLKRTGRDLRGLCPFHGEKTPSFYVAPEKRMFHCFGCGKSGDAIKFVMEIDGKSFREAVEQLATEFGVVLESEDPLERKRVQRRAAIAEVNEKACVFFERVLWEHPKGAIAREHLEKRGCTVETAKAWRLGYAPALWDALSKSLARSKIAPDLIEEAGLAVPRKGAAGGQGRGRADGSLYDRFRGRLTIPIRESGRTVAFGGRILEGESDAKYLNSPETPLYQKGNTLFGLDRARDSIRKEGVALFVEGYFDAIGLHQAGVQTAVATCGTAMTERHLELVARAGAKELVFVFDGDNAGIRAATRASELAAAAGVAARVLVPPDGEDPDETVARVGTPAFREMLREAPASLQFLLERALAGVGANASIEARVRAVASVAGIVRAAPNALARELYVEKVAEKLGASVEVVRLALAESAREQAAHPAHGSGSRASSDAGPRTADSGSGSSRNPRDQQQRASRGAGPSGLQTGASNGSGGPSSTRPAANGADSSRFNRSSQDAPGRSQQGSARDPRSGHAQADGATDPRSNPPPRPAEKPVRRDAPLQELHLVAQILQSVELAQFAAAHRGGEATATFANATLRDLAERIFAQGKAGALDREGLISTIDDDALRARLSRLVAEAASGRVGQDAAGAELEKKRLAAALDKHARTAGAEEIVRRRAARNSRNQP